MRHRKKGKILDRKKEQREALIRNLAISLIFHDKIKTTEAKAKALRPFIERIITIGKENNLTTRRRLISLLNNQEAVNKVLNIISPKYKERPGGYTRIIKIAQRRKGDAAKMALIEFV
jgi:large subunit ribosomal protein L17